VTSAGYKVLPAVYDRWQATYGKDYSALIFPRLLKTFRRYGIPATRILDLACGTGSLALLLRPYGWRILAVDGSAGMVREARAKCRPFRSFIHVARQDMRVLKLSKQVDVCTCMFDSFNHLLTLRDLRSAFRGVSRALAPQGWLIFDVNNEHCYRTLWHGTQTVHHREFDLYLENRYAPRSRIARSMVHLHWRERTRNKDAREVVAERCFTPSEIKSTLVKTGFEVVECEDFNFSTVPSMGKLKSWWVAKKTN
jgi:SAM-dependent methyltransferase